MNVFQNMLDSGFVPLRISCMRSENFIVNTNICSEPVISILNRKVLTIFSIFIAYYYRKMDEC